MEIKSRRVGDVMVHEHFVDGVMVEQSFVPVELDVQGFWEAVVEHSGKGEHWTSARDKGRKAWERTRGRAWGE